MARVTSMHRTPENESKKNLDNKPSTDDLALIFPDETRYYLRRTSKRTANHALGRFGHGVPNDLHYLRESLYEGLTLPE